MLKTKFPNTPIMALTATATEKVRADVMKQLKMKQRTTSLFKSSFDRPNLSWIVIAKETKSKQKSLEQLLKFAKNNTRLHNAVLYIVCHKKIRKKLANISRQIKSKLPFTMLVTVQRTVPMFSKIGKMVIYVSLLPRLLLVWV